MCVRSTYFLGQAQRRRPRGRVDTQKSDFFFGSGGFRCHRRSVCADGRVGAAHIGSLGSFFPRRYRHGIIPAPSKGLTTQNAIEGKAKTDHRTPRENGFQCIAGAGGGIAATAGTFQGREHLSIEQNGQDQKVAGEEKERFQTDQGKAQDRFPNRGRCNSHFHKASPSLGAARGGSCGDGLTSSSFRNA